MPHDSYSVDEKMLQLNKSITRIYSRYSLLDYLLLLIIASVTVYFGVFIGNYYADKSGLLEILLLIGVFLTVGSYWFGKKSQTPNQVFPETYDIKDIDSILIGTVISAIVAVSALVVANALRQLGFLPYLITITLILSLNTLSVLAVKSISSRWVILLSVLAILGGNVFLEFIALMDRSINSGRLEILLISLLFTLSALVLSLVSLRLISRHLPARTFKKNLPLLILKLPLPSYSGLGSVFVTYWLSFFRSRVKLSLTVLFFIMNFVLIGYGATRYIVIISDVIIVSIIMSHQSAVRHKFRHLFKHLPIQEEGLNFSLLATGSSLTLFLSGLLSLLYGYPIQNVVLALTSFVIVDFISNSSPNQMLKNNFNSREIWQTILQTSLIFLATILAINFTVLTLILTSGLVIIASIYRFAFKQAI